MPSTPSPQTALARPPHAPLYCATCKRDIERKRWWLVIRKFHATTGGLEKLLRCPECREYTSIPLSV